MATGLERLTAQQKRLVGEWLPGATVEEDHSWDLVETTVLRLVHDGSRLIVKAGGEGDRTSRARSTRTSTGSRPGPASAVRRLCGTSTRRRDSSSRPTSPDDLVLGSEHADDPGAYRQAGRAPSPAPRPAGAASTTTTSPGEPQGPRLAGQAAPDRALTSRRGCAPRSRRWPAPAATLVPTHGDWQPRNWVVHDGLVGVPADPPAMLRTSPGRGGGFQPGADVPTARRAALRDSAECRVGVAGVPRPIPVGGRD